MLSTSFQNLISPLSGCAPVHRSHHIKGIAMHFLNSVTIISYVSQCSADIPLTSSTLYCTVMYVFMLYVSSEEQIFETWGYPFKSVCGVRCNLVSLKKWGNVFVLLNILHSSQKPMFTFHFNQIYWLSVFQ